MPAIVSAVKQPWAGGAPVRNRQAIGLGRRCVRLEAIAVPKRAGPG
jgi:hypothetical protein